MATDRRRAGRTRRRRELVDCATPPRHWSKKQKSLGLHNLPACLIDQDFRFVCTENFPPVVRCVLQSKISQEYCASEQWSVTQRIREDCGRMLLDIEDLTGVGENNDRLEIDSTSGKNLLQICFGNTAI